MALMIVSCSSVSMNKPLPNNTTEDQRGELVGEWEVEGGSCKVNFNSKGVGHLARLEWDDESGQFEVERQSFIVTQVGDDLYLSLQHEDEGDVPSYKLVQCIVSEENLVVWVPDTERFEELIKQKKLTAEVTHGKHSTDVALTSSPKEIVEVLKIEKGLFKYKEPLVLKRLTK